MLPHHGRYNYSVIDRRADYTWPEGKRLAFYLSVAVEHFAFGTGVAEDRSSGQSQWSGWKLERNYGWRDYGQRVGLWNLLAMLDALRLPIAHPVNSLIFRSQPQIGCQYKYLGQTHSNRAKEFDLCLLLLVVLVL